MENKDSTPVPLVSQLPDLYVMEKDNQGTYFIRNVKNRMVCERNSNQGHVEAMCKWLNTVYRKGADDAFLIAAEAYLSASGIDPEEERKYGLAVVARMRAQMDAKAIAVESPQHEVRGLGTESAVPLRH